MREYQLVRIKHEKSALENFTEKYTILKENQELFLLISLRKKHHK